MRLSYKKMKCFQETHNISLMKIIHQKDAKVVHKGHIIKLKLHLSAINRLNGERKKIGNKLIKVMHTNNS